MGGAVPSTIGYWVVAGSVVVFGIKLTAYYLTGSVAVLSDAMESVVNIVSAVFLCWVLRIALTPPDSNHPYGHGKAEAFSAGLEGSLILCASVFIFLTAMKDLITGAELHSLNIGLLAMFIASAVNILLATVLARIGRRDNSKALTASSKHLMSDVWTTAGVFIGLAAVYLTGWSWLDPLVAMAVAVHLLREGVLIVRDAVNQLMDAADDGLLDELIQRLNRARQASWINAHQLRAWHAGRDLHTDMHLVVPYYYTALQLHDIHVDIAAALLEGNSDNSDAVIHFDPCTGRYCPECRMSNCSVRQAPAERHHPFDRRAVLINDTPDAPGTQ